MILSQHQAQPAQVQLLFFQECGPGLCGPNQKAVPLGRGWELTEGEVLIGLQRQASCLSSPTAKQGLDLQFGQRLTQADPLSPPNGSRVAVQVPERMALRPEGLQIFVAAFLAGGWRF